MRTWFCECLRRELSFYFGLGNKGDLYKVGTEEHVVNEKLNGYTLHCSPPGHANAVLVASLGS